MRARRQAPCRRHAIRPAVVGRQLIWLGPARAGPQVTVWVDTERLHVLGLDGGRIKSTSSRLSQRDLAWLRAEGGRPARPSPLPPVRPELPPAVEVDRLASVNGCINIAGKQIAVGSPLAGQRVPIRLDGILLQVIDDAGHVRRTMRCPVTPAGCARLRGSRPAGPSAGPTRTARSSTGSSAWGAPFRSPVRRSALAVSTPAGSSTSTLKRPP